ncbi:hypothetical protein EV361DRAFT_563937 [Lentinula raphanica]|nr:hypothetical protein EV361DRAFT_563937 [Lentinula raphanica]
MCLPLFVLFSTSCLCFYSATNMPMPMPMGMLVPIVSKPERPPAGVSNGGGAEALVSSPIESHPNSNPNPNPNFTLGAFFPKDEHKSHIMRLFRLRILIGTMIQMKRTLTRRRMDRRGMAGSGSTSTLVFLSSNLRLRSGGLASGASEASSFNTTYDTHN